MRCCGPAAPLGASARLRRCGRCAASATPPPPPPPGRARQAKNPADWGRDYDAIRDSLHRDKASLFSFSGALNFISDSFGGGAARSGRSSSGGLGEALLSGAYSLLYRAGGRFGEQEEGESGRTQVDPAPLLRASARCSEAERAAATAAWRDGEASDLAPLLACGVAVLTREAGASNDALPAELAALAAHVATRMRALCGTLQCSPTAAALALRREPPLLTVGSAQLAARVVALRAAAPRADVARLALSCPRLLAAPDAVVAAWAGRAAALRDALPGVDICLMAQEDAELLFFDTSAGAAQLSSLWSADELGTLEAEHASLALRALSGLPRRSVISKR